MASRFWVGGTGTWDGSSTTHWAASSGGASGASVPGSADTVTFDGSSGGGTVTVATDVSVQSITCGAFTGTLDFSVNNNNVTLSATTGFSGTGTGTRTIKLGNGTWTFTTTAAGAANVWNMGTTTNLTFDAGSSVLSFTGDAVGTAQRVFSGGGLTYNAIEISAQTKGLTFQISGANTIGRLTATGRNAIDLAANQTITTLELNGTSSGPIIFKSNSDGTARTVSVAANAPTMTYCAIRDIAGTGGASFVANNSFDLGNNSGVTINGPAAAGGLLASPGLSGGMAA